MSNIACSSPSLYTLKRPWVEEELTLKENQQHQHHQCVPHTVKRARRSHPHPGSASKSAAAAYAQPAAQAVAVLLAYFPGMDEKIVTEALVDCGNSIDAAIQRLTGLHLHNEDATAAAAAAGLTQHSLSHLPTQNPADPEACAGPSQPTNSHPFSSAATADVACRSPLIEEPSGPQSAEQWVDFLISEMARCQNMGDARVRAAGVLQHFERFVKARSRDDAKTKLIDTQRENAILKKAVQIQNSKLSERASQDQEVQQLQQLLTQYQEQVHNLELRNYSLTLHLQKATSSEGLGSHHNPDVF